MPGVDFGKLIGPAARLFDQQMWCWGRDVKRPNDLLSAQGFRRLGPPPGLKSVGHARPCDGGGWMVLWAFGMFLGHPDDGGMFVRRYGFHPLACGPFDAATAFRVGGTMPAFGPVRFPGERDRLAERLAVACRLVAASEAWVRESRGPDYRRECVRGWLRPALPADDMERAWHGLADDARSLIEESHREGPPPNSGFPTEDSPAGGGEAR